LTKSSESKIRSLKKKGAEIGDGVFIHETAEIISKDIKIGDSVYVGENTRISARSLFLGDGVRIGRNCILKSNQIRIHENSKLGDDNDIQPYELFQMGRASHFGNQTNIRGREVTFGDEVFITNGFRVGGGGRNEPDAILTVGDRCTMHNNFINVARQVTIGNDVGFSPETILITHGYWQSVLEGYTATFAPITVHDWVIIGMRAIILPGVEIGESTTVGAGSVVSRSLPAKCVAAGIPAKVIKSNYPTPISDQKQNDIMIDILHRYKDLLSDKGYSVVRVDEIEEGVLLEFERNGSRTNISFFRESPIPSQAFNAGFNIVLTFGNEVEQANTTIMNLKTLKILGEVNPVVQDLRDFLRRYGIRFFGYGFFESLPPQIALDLDDELGEM
jgi:acetyltransferase-like isoleucine patch superfamily enzyme